MSEELQHVLERQPRWKVTGPGRERRLPSLGFDLDFRPSSYWDEPRSPIDAILSNVKGRNRREMIRDALAGRDTSGLLADGIDAQLLEQCAPQGFADRMSRIDPSWLGGEFLPDSTKGEVEIARINLASTLSDVYSIRARRSRVGGRIRYRIVDEYNSMWSVFPASSARPFTLRQLARFIDDVAYDMNNGDVRDAFWHDLIAPMVQDGDRARALRFLEFESSHYPDLGDYFKKRIERWVDETLKANEMEAA